MIFLKNICNLWAKLHAHDSALVGAASELAKNILKSTPFVRARTQRLLQAVRHINYMFAYLDIYNTIQSLSIPADQICFIAVLFSSTLMQRILH